MCRSHGLYDPKRLSKDGKVHEILEAASHMLALGLEVSPRAFRSITQTCLREENLESNRFLLSLIVKYRLLLDPILGCQLIRLFISHNSLPEANQVFHCLAKPNKFTWSAIILANATLGQEERAIELYHRMQYVGLEPDGHVFVAALKGCANAKALVEGKHIEIDIKGNPCKSNTIVANAVIDILEHAYKVFDSLPKTIVVTWNAMISGYVDQNKPLKAVVVFQLMQQRNMQPNHVTFLCIIKACTEIPSVDFGITDAESHLEIHVFIVFVGFEGKTMVANSLIDMYTRFGDLKDAHRVFDKLSKRDTVSWNTLMTGYVQHLYNEEASALFLQMQLEGGEPDRATFLCILKACSDISAVDQINTLFHLIVKSSFEADEIIQSSIFNLYVKCGNLKNASCLSCRLQNRDLVTWNATIARYAQHGNSKAVQQLFNSMQSEGVQPDETTFLSLLTTISHAGSLSEGKSLFRMMQEDYGVLPALDHFNCLIDLLGRAGHIKEAEDLLQSMPPAPDIISWTSLLEHSKTHANLEVGKRCYSNFVSLDKEDASVYVLMWKLFSEFWIEDSASSVADLVRHVDALTMSRKKMFRSRSPSILKDIFAKDCGFKGRQISCNMGTLQGMAVWLPYGQIMGRGATCFSPRGVTCNNQFKHCSHHLRVAQHFYFPCPQGTAMLVGKLQADGVPIGKLQSDSFLWPIRWL
ncbi:hypothetical protein GOP47_0006201 [Adiantum capillus-veneris]|uniref:Pentatricopeptide repeat-containing protein n=1 Tax=Adiantum capillus-veneris TaxID=13818 RepID=A0A9D4V301_ADICA|nr:hypothetical protein GOP47_0006201 [Adiantum capillus-veneris]